MFSLTKDGNRLNLGFRSLKLLFDILRVFKFFNSSIESGNSSILLLCRSNTDRFGALSKF